MWHKEVTSHSIAKSSTHFGHLHQPVLDLLMIAPIQVQCIFPIPFWSILKWNHMHLIPINQNWDPVVLIIATNVRDPHLGHE